MSSGQVQATTINPNVFNPEALVGNYQGIVLDLTVIENGQPVRQLSGYGMLRIDAERGARKK